MWRESHLKASQESKAGCRIRGDEGSSQAISDGDVTDIICIKREIDGQGCLRAQAVIKIERRIGIARRQGNIAQYRTDQGTAVSIKPPWLDRRIKVYSEVGAASPDGQPDPGK